MDELVQFVADRLAEEIEWERRAGVLLITHGVPTLGGDPVRAGEHVRFKVQAAETKLALFDETIRPYLGTAGPTGRIAEQQLRLLAFVHGGDHEDYRNSWRP